MKKYISIATITPIIDGEWDEFRETNRCDTEHDWDDPEQEHQFHILARWHDRAVPKDPWSPPWPK